MKKTENKQPVQLTDAILAVMEALSKALEDETRCLSRQDFNGINTAREAKTRLVRDYQTNIGLLAQKPELLQEAPEDIRARLRATGEKLDKVTQQNVKALQGAIGATQSLIQYVMDTARSETRHTDCYTDPRKTAVVQGRYSPTCKPVAINRTA